MALKIKIKASDSDAKEMLGSSTPKVSRPESKSPDSQFKAGSEGSRIETENPREYPCEKLSSMQTPKETDHIFGSHALVDNRIHDDSPEMVRRKNNKNRDVRNGYRITDNRVYADKD